MSRVKQCLQFIKLSRQTGQSCFRLRARHISKYSLTKCWETIFDSYFGRVGIFYLVDGKIHLQVFHNFFFRSYFRFGFGSGFVTELVTSLSSMCSRSNSSSVPGRYSIIFACKYYPKVRISSPNVGKLDKRKTFTISFHIVINPTCDFVVIETFQYCFSVLIPRLSQEGHILCLLNIIDECVHQFLLAFLSYMLVSANQLFLDDKS